MTRFRQRLTAGIVLAAVSGVSILVGGAMVGSASADDEPPGTTATPPVATAAAAGLSGGASAFLPANAEGATCSIHIDDGGGWKSILGFGGKPGNIEVVKAAGGGDGVAMTFTASAVSEAKMEAGTRFDGPVSDVHIIEGEGGEVRRMTFEGKPLSPEEVDRLVAEGKLKLLTPEDCTVISSEAPPTEE